MSVRPTKQNESLTLDLLQTGQADNLAGKLERRRSYDSGRHPDDRGLSFCFHSPSGWLFEYAWQLQTIDPNNWTTEKYLTGAANGWAHAGLFSPEQ
jgi:hypothetical protein